MGSGNERNQLPEKGATSPDAEFYYEVAVDEYELAIAAFRAVKQKSRYLLTASVIILPLVVRAPIGYLPFRVITFLLILGPIAALTLAQLTVSYPTAGSPKDLHGKYHKHDQGLKKAMLQRASNLDKSRDKVYEKTRTLGKALDWSVGVLVAGISLFAVDYFVRVSLGG